MNIGIDYGREHLEVKVGGDLLTLRRAPQAPNLVDPVQAVREALENPIGFPALRRALTPDDHVVVAVDENLPQLSALLVPVIEHIESAGLPPEAITVVCPPSESGSDWHELLGDLPPGIAVELHDPADRVKLSYLAATRQGRRIYLNRTLVDADQVVVLAHRGYDPLLGYAGPEGILYPALSDEATWKAMAGQMSLHAPGAQPWPIRSESLEVAWLLGAPFLLQVIAGNGGQVAHVIGGVAASGSEGIGLLNARWRVSVTDSADLVIATVTGEPARQTFESLSRALASAARVVKPQGRIVLLTEAEPRLGAGAETLVRADEPKAALRMLAEQAPRDMAAAYSWAEAAQRAQIYLLSKLPPETAEELFTVPLDHASQVQRLLNAAATSILLSDADSTMAVLQHGND